MGFLANTMLVLLMLTGILLMFIVLLQRGRGGGLAGAFGGAGGQSAFGTKAGDVFTKITVVIAVVWVLLAGTSGLAIRNADTGRYRANEVSVTVTFPDTDQQRRFAWPKKSSVGRAAAEVAQEFDVDAPAPTFLGKDGQELDPGMPLEDAGVSSGDRLTLIAEASAPATPSMGEFGEDEPADDLPAEAPEDAVQPPAEDADDTPEAGTTPGADADTPDESPAPPEEGTDAKPDGEDAPLEEKKPAEGADDAPQPDDAEEAPEVPQSEPAPADEN